MVVTNTRAIPPWDDMAVVGRVARSHGLHGYVVVDPETDFPDARYQAGGELFGRVGDTVVRWVVTDVRFHKQRPIVRLEGIDSIEAADAIAGTELRIPRSQLAVLPQGSYYRHDLVGCLVQVVGGTSLGVVREVEGDQGGSRLVVETSDGMVMIPLASAICTEIDVFGRRIAIVPPEGLLELNRSR